MLMIVLNLCRFYLIWIIGNGCKVIIIYYISEILSLLSELRSPKADETERKLIIYIDNTRRYTTTKL
jgi:hypothetical protein